MTSIIKGFAIGATILGVASGAAVGTAKVVETVVEKIEYVDYHQIEQTDKYSINGVEVTEDEFNNYIISKSQGIQQETQINKIVITADDMDIDGICRLSNYLDFSFDSYGKVKSAKVLSNKIKTISYEYSEGFMSYVVNNRYIGCAANVYQLVNYTDGLTFTVGPNSGIEFDIVESMDAVVGNYVFNFINNPSYKDIEFSDAFQTITLEFK